jgi:hypothetical protein
MVHRAGVILLAASLAVAVDDLARSMYMYVWCALL